MAIPFNTIPQATLRVPLAYFEINGAQTPYVSNSRLLFLAQMNELGSATPGEPVVCFGDPRDQFGVNSMAAEIVEKARLNAPFQEVWMLPMMDSGVGVAATGNVKLPRALTAAAATTGDVTLNAAPDAVDGVDLEANDLVLVWQQDDPTENGLYIVTSLGTGSNGSWSRATSMDAADEFEHRLTVLVGEGTTYAGQLFSLVRGNQMTVGTTEVNFDLTGVVPAAVTVSLWIGDIRVQSIAYSSDTGPTLAARLVAAINGTQRCPVTAAIAGGSTHQINLTARHKGTAGNTVILDTDYYGTEGPTAGVLFRITQMSGGTGDPDFTNALATLADDEYDWICGPYTDPVTLGQIETLLNNVSGRWSPYQQLYGHYTAVVWKNLSNSMTFGASRNSELESLFHVYQAATPIWGWVGALGGRIAAHLSEPPELSRPLQSLPLIGCLPPKSPANRTSINERNSLYWSGIGAYATDGKTRTAKIDRVVTTYQRNAWGSPDAVWLDIETRAQAMYVARSFRAAITGAFPRAILMDENPEGLPGVATPQDIRNVLIHDYRRMAALAVVENPELFAESLIVERSAQDANRVDAYLPVDVANQLRIFAANTTIYLQRQRQAPLLAA